MDKPTQTFWRYAIVPLIALSVLLIYLLIVWIFDLPNFQELTEIARNYYQTYGYIVVFISALIEGFLFVNWYFPGSFVLAFGVVFAAEGSLNPIVVVATIIAGFFIMSILNYLIGRYGFYRIFMKLGMRHSLTQMHERMEKYGLPIIFVTYFHPNISALASVAAGMLQLEFWKFLLFSIPALIFWNALAGTVVYFSGPAILKILSAYGMIGLLLVWILFMLVNYLRKRQKG